MTERKVTPSSRETGVYGDWFERDASFANWRPHGSGDWLLIYTEAGAGRIASASGPCLTEPGEIILYAPGEPQDYATADSAGEWQLLWAHFTPKPHWQPGAGWPLNPAGVRCLALGEGDAREQFSNALRRMNRLVRHASPARLDLAYNALEEALLWAALAVSQSGEPRIDPRVARACELLSANLRTRFDLGALARKCGLSVSRLSYLFKAQTGLSPQRYLEQARMQHAAELLRRTSLTVAQVADETGYEDPFYFSNRFRRFSGKSPSTYRARQSGDDLPIRPRNKTS